jgi:DNA-binding transcriptional ArsR family regulator
MIRTDAFNAELQELARFAKAISHPARLAILKFLAETKTCISGDISGSLPLSRSTVTQHLKVLKNLNLIHGKIDGLKVNYCLHSSSINDYLEKFEGFFTPIREADVNCELDVSSESQEEKNEHNMHIHREK